MIGKPLDENDYDEFTTALNQHLKMNRTAAYLAGGRSLAKLFDRGSEATLD